MTAADFLHRGVVALVLLMLCGVQAADVDAAPLGPGDVLVADQGGFVYHYSATGADLGPFVSGLSSPSWLTVDRRANVYVVDTGVQGSASTRRSECCC